MKRTRWFSGGLAAVGITALLVGSAARLGSQPSAAPAVSIGPTDLGGVVTGANGPEAGVWVIAETTDLPTRYAKMVATHDGGRYVMPELPNATYRVWVRGYGLVDSPPVTATPGKVLDLRAVVAPSAAAAAEYYPAIYWYALLRIPEKSSSAGRRSKEALPPQPKGGIGGVFRDPPEVK